ncbi:hypothetical protein HU200_063395 [Digitaria exilis]|uniref:Uncharacterized protein n=1 Tax=Digitaria exilis TaxID=1010633 RepID=A0A835A3W1_9POAL|nr:hypothetical protein HU200_063395 [Digitaria exilis]
MANRKAPIAAAILCLCFVRAQCDHSPEQEQEIQMLKSKVASLGESSRFFLINRLCAWEELPDSLVVYCQLSSFVLEDEISRRKEETSQLESVVRERTAQMVALVGELELLQKVNVADDESVIKANTNVDMLEEQIDRLGNDLEDQVRKGESLEARATEAEKRLHEFSRKLDHAESINVEQRMKIRDLDDKLQDAQDKISELENEAKLKAEELAMVHGTWLPHWLAVRVLRCQVRLQISLKLITGAMQVKNGVEGFLEESRLVTPLPADKVAWLTVGFGLVHAAGDIHLQGLVSHHPVSSHPQLPIPRHISSVAFVVLLLILQSALWCALLQQENSSKEGRRQQPQEQAL